MKQLKLDNPLFLYGGAAIFTFISAIVLKLGFSPLSYIYNFYYRCWYVQFFSTWLFFIGIVFWINRYAFFKEEEKVFQKIKMPKDTIYRDKAKELIDMMPKELRHTLTLRRFQELLQAFLYGEDILRLNEEFSRRDLAQVESGHLILNTLRNLIPVIGFLGTVIGLSMGMLQFPEVADIEKLRIALKGFAASLSVAFDTTLLGLGYTIILILLTSFLRQREEELVSKVDERARMLISKIKVEMNSLKPSEKETPEEIEPITHIINDALERWNRESSVVMKEFFMKLTSQNGELAREIAKELTGAVQQAGSIVVQKFEEIKQGLHSPPHYQIIVQPLKENETQDEK